MLKTKQNHSSRNREKPKADQDASALPHETKPDGKTKHR